MQRFSIFPALLMLAAVAGCGDVTAPDAADDPVLAGAAAADHNVSPVVARADGSTDGWAKITRTANGVTATAQVSGLMPNHAYTVWFTVFDPSGPTALGTKLLDGKVIGGSGKATFSGHWNDPPGDPLTNGVHLVFRDHGPKIPGMVHEQISTAAAACPCVDTHDVIDVP